MSRRLIFSIAAVLAVAACSEQDSTAPNEAPLAAAVGSNSQAYVISYSAAQSGDLSQAITRAGGKMKKLSSGAGLATATASNADFAAELSKAPGVKRVVQDMVVQWVPQQQFGVAPDAGRAYIAAIVLDPVTIQGPFGDVHPSIRRVTACPLPKLNRRPNALGAIVRCSSSSTGGGCASRRTTTR